MAVPVPDLLQMTHPGYPLVERDMHISQQNVQPTIYSLVFLRSLTMLLTV